MRCLLASEAETWLLNHKLGHALSSRPPKPNVFGNFGIMAALPLPGKHQQDLARRIIRWIGAFDSALLWLTDWPFYQPEEMAIIDGLRRAHGESRRLIEAPVILFEGSEGQELTGWLYLMIAFGWDAYLFASPFGGRMIQTSHHDVISIFANTQSDFDAAQKIVDAFNLKVHRTTLPT